MTEKEWKIIGEEFISYTGGCAILITDGDCQFHLWETRKDAQKVCDKLNEIAEENSALKIDDEFKNKSYSKLLDSFIDLKKKYQTLKKDKQMLKIVDDYLLEYDGDYFDLHKPSDIRSLVYLFNRCNGFSELECEYNKKE